MTRRSCGNIASALPAALAPWPMMTEVVWLASAGKWGRGGRRETVSQEMIQSAGAPKEDMRNEKGEEEEGKRRGRKERKRRKEEERE